MIKAGIFDVGGVLHKSTLFSPEDFLIDHIKLSEEEFHKHYVHKEVLQIVKRLKEQQMPLAILSNTVAEHAMYLTQKGMYDEFDELIFSYQINMRKPDPQIYKVALQKIDAAAHETFYVDDLQINVDTANLLGMHGILFTSASELEKELKNIGITL